MENMLHNLEMFITKSTIQDGQMRWAAINSDTDKDLYGERMTMELYQKMLSYIKNGTPPPEEFKSMVCSDYWKGGMPYVSLAHYPDLNGEASLGEPLVIYTDGNRLKAKGFMYDTPLGRAAWNGIKKDENLPKDEDKIRISIAFLDLAHKHGEDGKVFERKSLSSRCPDCAKGKGEKIYVDGYLVHLALTRKPVNPRTAMEEDIMAKKSQITTRKEDAVSIVGDAELVDAIEKSALEVKSDVLIEMSETDEPVVEEAKTKAPVEEEDSPEDDKEDMKEKKGKKECSLTEGDVEVIRNLIAEALPKAVVVETPAPVTEKSALDIATDELYNSIDGAIKMQSVTIEERLESINPALGNLGNAITSLVRESVGVKAPAPISNDQTLVLEAITSLTNTVKELASKVAVVEEKSRVEAPVQPKIPAPRSIQQPVVTQSQVAPAKPGSVSAIVRRSVGLQD